MPPGRGDAVEINDQTADLAPSRPVEARRRSGQKSRPRRHGWTSSQIIVAVKVAAGSCITTWLITESTPVTLSVGAATTALLGLAFYLHR